MTRMFRTLLKGQALCYFEYHLMRALEAEDSDVPDNELIEIVLGDVGLECIPKRVIRVQKYTYLILDSKDSTVISIPATNLDETKSQ
jgi:hypothetical protein